MPGPYAYWMDRWERKLATRDTNRVVRPFEWGTEWLHSIGFPPCPEESNGDAAACLARFATEAVAHSERLYSYVPVQDFRLQEDRLTFTSPVESPYPKNNTVHARWFPADRDRGRALVVLPQSLPRGIERRCGCLSGPFRNRSCRPLRAPLFLRAGSGFPPSGRPAEGGN